MIVADSSVNSVDAAPAVYGSTNAIFRRVELFHEALVFMILRGDKAQLATYTFTPKEPSSQLPEAHRLTRMSINFILFFTDDTFF